MPPGLSSVAARSSRRVCRAVSLARSASDLSQGMSGCRRIVPVDEQGASTSTASNGPPCHCRGVGLDDLGGELQPREILPQPLEARRRAVDRGDLRAGERELRGLAARRGAEIGDGFAARRRPSIAEQPRRQRRGGVLHPPCAVVVAGKLRDRPRCDRCAPCRSAARGRRASPPMSRHRS